MPGGFLTNLLADLWRVFNAEDSMDILTSLFLGTPLWMWLTFITIVDRKSVVWERV